MSLALLMAVQAAGAAAPGVSQPAPSGDVAPITFDLAEAAAAAEAERHCGTSIGNEIVVCGRREGGDGSDPRMARWAVMFAQRPLVAETPLGDGVTGRVFLDQGTLANGQVSNRVMVGIRLPF